MTTRTEKLEARLEEAEDCLMFLQRHQAEHEICSVINRTVEDYFKKYPIRKR